MYLKNLHILNFKNSEQADLELSPRINCFLGNNGEGKTNLLDAIFYLAFCKSYFNPADSQIIKHEAPFMVVEGEFTIKDNVEKIYCGLKRGQKKQFKRNKKEYEKLADHIGLIPLVMISPSDSELILEGSEVRRRFVDLIISQYNRAYLENLIQYNKALAHRNRLLKKFLEIRSFDETSLEIWDEQLIRYGQPIFEARHEFIQSFIPLFQKYYDFISDKKEAVNLVYESQLLAISFEELLKENREKDRRRTYSNAGIHKDDLSFELEGKPIKKFGSQGQQKTFLLALKLAQAEFLKNLKQISPILLLDDIYDKLDEFRVARLMEVVQDELFGQVFISDANTHRLPDLFDKLKADHKVFTVKDGVVNHV